MKALSASLAIVALLASPAFAAQSSSISQSAVGTAQKSTITNAINTTDVGGSVLITDGKGTTSQVGVIENKGGAITNVVNETKMDDTVMITTGGAKAQVGVVSNQ